MHIRQAHEVWKAGLGPEKYEICMGEMCMRFALEKFRCVEFEVGMAPMSHCSFAYPQF